MDTTRYRHHLRPHTEDEAIHLRESILAEGCRDPLIVAILEGKQYLIDGFNRLAICTEHGKEYQTREIVFSAHEDVLRWIERNARARRNQTRTERAYYLGCRYNREKGSHGATKGEKRVSAQNVHLQKTVELIAAEEKVSHMTVQRAAKMAASIDSMGKSFAWLKWLILSERIKYSKKLVDTCVHLGSGGCREQIETLLTDNPEKSLSAGKILAAITGENDTEEGGAAEPVKEVEAEGIPEPDAGGSFEEVQDGLLSRIRDLVCEYEDPFPVRRLAMQMRSILKLTEARIRILEGGSE